MEICDSTVGSDSDGDTDLYRLSDGGQCFEDDSSVVGYLPECDSHHRGFGDVQVSRLVSMEQEVGWYLLLYLRPAPFHPWLCDSNY